MPPFQAETVPDMMSPQDPDQLPQTKQLDQTSEKPYVYKRQIVWLNTTVFILLHLGCLYGFYLMITAQVKMLTLAFTVIYAWMGGHGITGGAHRLWAHKAYKAKWPLRVMLCIWQTCAFQNHIYEWVRDHRVHHKFCDTDADPHNSKRGFFFSHIGWLMVKKHRDVIEMGKTVDISDLEKDWVVMFQKKYYLWMMPLFCFIIPTTIPWYFWGEDIWVAYWVAGVWRWITSLHFTWLVNSAAHMWGDKPYDRSLSATQNLAVGILAFGEGWHNYHHAFPWDYKASELWHINTTTKFLNFMAKIGWAYDLKEASHELVNKRMARTGVEKLRENPHEGEIWGWDDKDMTKEDRNLVSIKMASHKSK